MFHKIQKVEPLADYRLFLTFIGGESKIYDVKPLLEKWPVFQTLTQVGGLFQQVKLADGGYAVVWNDDIDLECNELYFNGMPIENMSAVPQI